MDIKSHALTLAELGYHVFPCAPNEKRPLPGSQGLLDAATDPEKIERWWTDHPTANIALRTNGLLVIDVDGPDNPWLKNEPEKLAELMQAPMQMTPRGGRHYAFRCPEGKTFRSTASKIAPMVDTRADGGYIVVAPSTVNGKSYQWVDGLTLDMTPDKLPLPPGWLVELLGEKQNSSKRSDGNEKPTIASEGGRNSLLTSLGGALRRSGLSQSEIEAALRQSNRERCNPPLCDKEVETIAWSVSRYEPDQVSTILAEGNGTVTLGDEVTEVDELPNDPGTIPDHLLNVPGFVNEVVEFTLQTAPYPQRSLAFLSAISLQSVLCARKVGDEYGNRPSLYLLALANSGAGKDHPRKVAQRVLFEIGMGNCLADSIGSAEGLEDSLFINPTTLLQLDEVDYLINAIKSGRDSRYDGILMTLMKLFTSSNGIYPMRLKADKKKDFIFEPALVVYATTVPKGFYESLSVKMLTNGFFARLLVMDSGERGDGQRPQVIKIPESIHKIAKWWADFNGGTGNLNQINPTLKMVKWDSDADKTSLTFQKECEREYRASEKTADQIGMAIWARAHEKFSRLSLIYACSQNYENPVVSKAAVQWAKELVMYLTRRMLYMVHCFVSESNFESKCKRALEVLRDWRSINGDKWMQLWQYARKLRGWTGKEHEEVRRALIEQGLIEQGQQQTKGRTGFTVRLIPVEVAGNKDFLPNQKTEKGAFVHG